MKAAHETALILVQKGGISISEAARLAAKRHDLEEDKMEPLRCRINYRLYAPPKQKRQLILSDEQERFLCDVIKAFSTRANPLASGDVLVLAQEIGDLESKPTTGWLGSFRKRHQLDVLLRKGKNSHKRSILLAAFDSVCGWLKTTQTTLNRLVLAAFLVFNIDETRALPASRLQSLMAAKSLKETHYQQAMDETLYTLVSCIAADGSTLFCIYLFRLVPTKDELRQNIFVPQLAYSKRTRKDSSYSIYVAVTPKGYMNGAVWMETMKIFLSLVEFRQGIGRPKQAVLYLDGCASHLKQDTNDLLANNNVTTIWFPSNTSYILQPLDGEAFAAYKATTRKETHSTALAASVGALNEKQMSLLACLRSHEKAVTPQVVKASFKGRGIYPWNPALALANARLACPTDRLLGASGEICSLFYAEKLVDRLKDYFMPKVDTERMMIKEVNSPTKLSELEKWSRRPPSKKKRVVPLPYPKKTVISMIESDDEDILSESFDSDSEDPIVPPIRRSRSSNSCSHCFHQRLNGTVPLACFTCCNFWLCMNCQFNTNALSEHQKEHPELEGRPTRFRR